MAISFPSRFSDSPFLFHSRDSILPEKALGIAGQRGSVRTPSNFAGRFEALQNCPFTGTGLTLDFRVNGELAPVTSWDWLPNAILRTGSTSEWDVQTLTAIAPASDAFPAGVCVVRFDLHFKGISTPDVLPLQFVLTGSARRESDWLFGMPAPGELHFSRCAESVSDGASVLTLSGNSKNPPEFADAPLSPDDAVLTLASDLPGLDYFALADIWETEYPLNGASGLSFTLLLYLDGAPHPASPRIDRSAFDAAFDSAFSWLDAENDRIFANLPHFSSDNPALDALYYRSLVPYILNRWVNPEMKVSPFYTTGSITGGCMCSYLWDYGGGLQVHPIVDPDVSRAMIRAFLHIDLTSAFAVKPLAGDAYGPWYHINQEKITSMIYYHVLHTGDRDFLFDTLDGRTILDWAIFHACIGDDLSAPPALMDYGEAGRSHLELRRDRVYKGIMPDLNARRYMNYIRAYRLSEVAGKPQTYLLDRAKGLKALLPTLWDEDAGWYDFIWEGRREKRYTVQMFKFLDSPVIDDHTRAALVSHLNDREFLSRFGLHSMSKTDPAYDQLDIDNGGGGICQLFTMRIIGELYDTGYPELASDILSRVLWWGTRLPYWGDSNAANYLAVREDTPLQACISAVSAAQMLLFSLCGIHVSFDGTVTVSPASVRPASRIVLDSVTLRGRTFSLTIDGDSFTVSATGKDPVTAKIGETVEV